MLLADALGGSNRVRRHRGLDQTELSFRPIILRSIFSCKSREVYSVTAYVLYLNGIVSENEILNGKSLPKVKMPNRDGFVPDPRPDTGTLRR